MSVLRLLGGCLVAGALFCVLSASSAQQTQSSTQKPVFRSSTTVVEVDVVVQDKDGEFVFGLEADDLQIFEDGRPQPIQQFYVVAHDPKAGRMPESGIAPQTAQRGRRVFVLLFDEGSMAAESLMRVQKGAEAFILDQMRPGDLGGVFVDNELYQKRVTADRNALLVAIKSAKPGTEHRQSLLAAFREFPRIPGELDAVRIAEGSAELALRLAQQNCREDAVACNYAGGVQAVDNIIERKSRLFVSHSRILTDRTMTNLKSVIDGLSAIPGRKTVVLLSEGFFIEEMRNQAQMLAARAARGGTTIYSIDGRGLTHGMGAAPDVLRASLPRSTEFDTGDTGPVIFTQGTGGFSLRNIDDISRALNMIARDTSTYYVIGYSPTKTNWDGKFRKIEVKSHIPGLKIRARKGYAAIPLTR